MRKTNDFLHERRIIMTLSTFAAGLVIVAVTVAIEWMEKDYEKQKEEFENSN
jgi:hypothetical protein